MQIDHQRLDKTVLVHLRFTTCTEGDELLNALQLQLPLLGELENGFVQNGGGFRRVAHEELALGVIQKRLMSGLRGDALHGSLRQLCMITMNDR